MEGSRCVSPRRVFGIRRRESFLGMFRFRSAFLASFSPPRGYVSSSSPALPLVKRQEFARRPANCPTREPDPRPGCCCRTGQAGRPPRPFDPPAPVRRMVVCQLPLGGGRNAAPWSRRRCRCDDRIGRSARFASKNCSAPRWNRREQHEKQCPTVDAQRRCGPARSSSMQQTPRSLTLPEAFVPRKYPTRKSLHQSSSAMTDIPGMNTFGMSSTGTAVTSK